MEQLPPPRERVRRRVAAALRVAPRVWHFGGRNLVVRSYHARPEQDGGHEHGPRYGRSRDGERVRLQEDTSVRWRCCGNGRDVRANALGDTTGHARRAGGGCPRPYAQV